VEKILLQKLLSLKERKDFTVAKKRHHKYSLLTWPPVLKKLTGKEVCML